MIRKWRYQVKESDANPFDFQPSKIKTLSESLIFVKYCLDGCRRSGQRLFWFKSRIWFPFATLFQDISSRKVFEGDYGG